MVDLADLVHWGFTMSFAPHPFVAGLRRLLALLAASLRKLLKIEPMLATSLDSGSARFADSLHLVTKHVVWNAARPSKQLKRRNRQNLRAGFASTLNGWCNDIFVLNWTEPAWHFNNLSGGLLNYYQLK
jgi:hypothetical protein